MEKKSLDDLIKEHDRKSDLFWKDKAPLTESESNAIQEFAEKKNLVIEKFLDTPEKRDRVNQILKNA